MRLGIASGLQHSSPEEWAENLNRLGCKSVIFPVDCQASVDTIESYQREARKRDLTIAEVGIWKNAIAKDEKEARAAMDYSIGQLKLADAIHAKCCVNIAGAAGPLWDGPYRENFTQKTWDRTVRMIQEVIDEVKPQNTYFTMEPMPWMYPSGPEEYARLLEAVNRDRFAVHMDIINMINSPKRYLFMEEFVEKSFQILGSAIKSCHLKDIRMETRFTVHLQECACGEGGFCLERYIELAEEVDADMPMIIEHLNTDKEYIYSFHYVKRRLRLE